VSIFESQEVWVKVTAMLLVRVTVCKNVVAEDLQLLFILQLNRALEKHVLS
jgi:hypothetical protein